MYNVFAFYPSAAI